MTLPLAVLALACGALACSSSGYSTASPVGSGAGSGSPGSGGGSGGATGNSDGGVPSGVLTSGAWDDNRNYDFFTGYLAANASLSGSPPVARSDRDTAHALFSGARVAKQRLDIAIVIDTTGSMADEAKYLKSEFESMRTAIAALFPNSDQRWALVAYRDTPDHDPGDAYVVKSWDFTSDLGVYKSSLDGLDPANGGDTPESPDLGLAAMNTLAWRGDADVARIAFWVADAPHHDDKAQAMTQDFADARNKGIHLYPVMASGADALLELTMRSAAQLTGGRFLFLTDDSGIGNAHLEPAVPCYFVTKLASGIVRMVSIELSGMYAEPTASEIIRTGGNPTAGQCSLGDGGSVNVF